MRIRLKEKCHFAGKVYQAGEELILPDGIKGPHRPVRKTPDRIDYATDPPIDANRDISTFVDEPLYDVVDEHETELKHSDEQQKEADAAAERRAQTPAQPISPSEVVERVERADEVRTLTHIEEREQR